MTHERTRKSDAYRVRARWRGPFGFAPTLRLLLLLVAIAQFDFAIAQSSPPSQKSQTAQSQKPSGSRKSPAKKSRRAKSPPRAATPPVEEKPEVAPPPEQETLAAGLARLNRIKEKDLTTADSARRTAIEWFLSISATDARRAAKVLDVIGYQPLPAQGDLPEMPARPFSAAQMEALLASGRPIPSADLRMDRVAILDQRALAAYPALAAWSLPQEDCVVALHLPELAGENADYLVVVRVRAKRATVVGGTELPVAIGRQVAESDR